MTNADEAWPEFKEKAFDVVPQRTLRKMALYTYRSQRLRGIAYPQLPAWITSRLKPVKAVVEEIKPEDLQAERTTMFPVMDDGQDLWGLCGDDGEEC